MSSADVFQDAFWQETGERDCRIIKIRVFLYWNSLYINKILRSDALFCFFLIIRQIQRFALLGLGRAWTLLGEQEKKLEATRSEMLVNRAESPSSVPTLLGSISYH